MAATGHFEIFLATAPGLEAALYDEVRSLRFRAAKQIAGGVTVNGANVVTADIEATNGVIHVVDAVILPPAN